MINRKYLESQPHWQCTMQYAADGSFDCIMRNCKGGYYWHTPDYRGLFAAGATRQFAAVSMADSLARGYSTLIAGTLP